MGTMTKRSESISNHAFKGEVSQYEITSNLLRNLYKFDFTPIAKLVLLELTTHLNEQKNGSVVFPSIGYIAETLGIGLTACKKAINDLIQEGLIIKTKRENIKGNYNKYLLRLAKIDFGVNDEQEIFAPTQTGIKGGKNKNRCIYTQASINGQKTANEPPKNELLKKSDSDLFLHEQKKRTKKEQTVSESAFIHNSQLTIHNSQKEEFKILKDYAIKHGANNIEAYVNALIKNGSADKIICEYKKAKNATQRALRSIEETQSLINKYEEMKKNTCTAKECGCSLNDIMKNRNKINQM